MSVPTYVCTTQLIMCIHASSYVYMQVATYVYAFKVCTPIMYITSPGQLHFNCMPLLMCSVQSTSPVYILHKPIRFVKYQPLVYLVYKLHTHRTSWYWLITQRVAITLRRQIKGQRMDTTEMHPGSNEIFVSEDSYIHYMNSK